MFDFNEFDEVAPEPDRIKVSAYRKSKLDPLLKGFNRLHNKEYRDMYRRNFETYEFLKDIEIVHPQVTEALREERNLIESILIQIDTYLIRKHKEGLRNITIGYWWWLILGLDEVNDKNLETHSTVKFALPSGYCELKLDKWSIKSWFHSACDSEDYHTMDSDRIIWIKGD